MQCSIYQYAKFSELHTLSKLRLELYNAMP